MNQSHIEKSKSIVFRFARVHVPRNVNHFRNSLERLSSESSLYSSSIFQKIKVRLSKLRQ